MNDPRRLAEQDELSRLLIGSASDDLPGAEARAKARRAALAAATIGFGVGASVGLVTSSANAATKAAGWGALKWLALVSAPVAVASVSYVSLRQAEPPSGVGSEVARVSPRPRPPATGAPAAIAPPVAAASVAAAPAAVTAPASGSPAGATPRAPAAASLQAEITALDGARHALARGDGSVLDRYLAEHPRGALREQALWMKISSLEQAGRHAEAKALAKRMLASYPNGSFSTRARALIAR